MGDAMVLTGGVGILAAASEFFAAVGSANFWNPVGWACLIIAAVIVVAGIIYAIVQYWDEICAFFSSIWDWFTQMATIVYEWTVNTAIPWIVDTATATWDSIVSTFDKVGRRYRAGIDKWTLALTTALASTLIADEEVYVIYMNVPGFYDECIFRRGVLINHFEYKGLGATGRSGDSRYKYGTTKIYIKQARYSGSRIGQELGFRGRLSYITYQAPLNKIQSRILEKQLIYSYFAQHGAFPPGNSKLG